METVIDEFNVAPFDPSVWDSIGNFMPAPPERRVLTSCDQCQGCGLVPDSVPRPIQSTQNKRKSRDRVENQFQECPKCGGMGWSGVDPMESTTFPVGSLGRVAVYQMRRHMGLPLYVEGDNPNFHQSEKLICAPGRGAVDVPREIEVPATNDCGAVRVGDPAVDEWEEDWDG